MCLCLGFSWVFRSWSWLSWVIDSWAMTFSSVRVLEVDVIRPLRAHNCILKQVTADGARPRYLQGDFTDTVARSRDCGSDHSSLSFLWRNVPPPHWLSEAVLFRFKQRSQRWMGWFYTRTGLGCEGLQYLARVVRPSRIWTPSPVLRTRV